MATKTWPTLTGKTHMALLPLIVTSYSALTGFASRAPLELKCLLHVLLKITAELIPQAGWMAYTPQSPRVKSPDKSALVGQETVVYGQSTFKWEIVVLTLCTTSMEPQRPIRVRCPTVAAIKMRDRRIYEFELGVWVRVLTLRLA